MAESIIVQSIREERIEHDRNPRAAGSDLATAGRKAQQAISYWCAGRSRAVRQIEYFAAVSESRDQANELT
jgi:hypothetical protein